MKSLNLMLEVFILCVLCLGTITTAAEIPVCNWQSDSSLLVNNFNSISPGESLQIILRPLSKFHDLEIQQLQYEIMQLAHIYPNEIKSLFLTLNNFGNLSEEDLMISMLLRLQRVLPKNALSARIHKLTNKLLSEKYIGRVTDIYPPLAPGGIPSYISGFIYNLIKPGTTESTKFYYYIIQLLSQQPELLNTIINTNTDMFTLDYLLQLLTPYLPPEYIKMSLNLFGHGQGKVISVSPSSSYRYNGVLPSGSTYLPSYGESKVISGSSSSSNQWSGGVPPFIPGVVNWNEGLSPKNSIYESAVIGSNMHGTFDRIKTTIYNMLKPYSSELRTVYDYMLQLLIDRPELLQLMQTNISKLDLVYLLKVLGPYLPQDYIALIQGGGMYVNEGMSYQGSGPYISGVPTPGSSPYISGVPSPFPYISGKPNPNSGAYISGVPTPGSSPFISGVPSPFPYISGKSNPNSGQFISGVPTPGSGQYISGVPSPFSGPYISGVPNPNSGQFISGVPTPGSGPYISGVPSPFSGPYISGMPNPGSGPYINGRRGSYYNRQSTDGGSQYTSLIEYIRRRLYECIIPTNSEILSLHNVILTTLTQNPRLVSLIQPSSNFNICQFLRTLLPYIPEQYRYKLWEIISGKQNAYSVPNNIMPTPTIAVPKMPIVTTMQPAFSFENIKNTVHKILKPSSPEMNNIYNYIVKTLSDNPTMINSFETFDMNNMDIHSLLQLLYQSLPSDYRDQLLSTFFHTDIDFSFIPNLLPSPTVEESRYYNALLNFINSFRIYDLPWTTQHIDLTNNSEALEMILFFLTENDVSPEIREAASYYYIKIMSQRLNISYDFFKQFLPAPKNTIEEEMYWLVMNLVQTPLFYKILSNFQTGSYEDKTVLIYQCLRFIVQSGLLPERYRTAVKYYEQRFEPLEDIDLITTKEIKKHFKLSQMLDNAFEVETLPPEALATYREFYRYIVNMDKTIMSGFTTWDSARTNGEFVMLLLDYLSNHVGVPGEIKNNIATIKTFVQMSGKGALPI